MLFQEKITKELLEYNYRREGPILEGDEKYMWSYASKIENKVDGGIDFDNSKLVKKAGANILVSGTTIFKNNNGDIKKNIDALRTG